MKNVLVTLACIAMFLTVVACDLPWSQVQAKVCPLLSCPDCAPPTVDDAIDVLVDHGLDVITGNETGDD